MPALSPVVAERIRRPMPTDMGVLPGSLPVVSFGDPDTASVSTLSLNPSWREFLAPSGAWLLGDKRRLASLRTLGAEDPRDLDDAQVARVVAESNAYFRGPNWYKAWFHWLESLLKSSGVGSYLEGTACHLDLVQWATKPAQGDLSPKNWRRLVEEDRDFLSWQLGTTSVRVVLLNGASVARGVRDAGLVKTFEKETISYRGNNKSSVLTVFRATMNGVPFLGWNKPLAGALAAEGRQRLTQWVRDALAEHDFPNETTAEVRSDRASSAAPDLEDGFLPADTEVFGASNLERLLFLWEKSSGRSTIGDPGTYGGSRLITVKMGADQFVINKDTKRAAVRLFLAAAARAGGAANLSWHVTWNSRGTINRVTYLSDDAPTPGWYAYLLKPEKEVRAIG